MTLWPHWVLPESHYILKKTPLPDFSNKLLSIALFAEESSRPIHRPRWEMLGGKLFLIGKVPPGGSRGDWAEGILNAVAWDRVVEATVG